MDTIGDTQLAIEAYPRIPLDEYGSHYLLVYGILQSLFIQQDAIRDLAEALGIELPESDLFRSIRDIRNSVAGHPTKQRERSSNKSSNVISRPSMTRLGFEYIVRYHDDRPDVFKYVDIGEILDGQSSEVRTALGAVITELEREEMSHRKEFRDTLLSDSFPPTLSYYFENVIGHVKTGQGWAL